MRGAFAQAITELGEQDERIVLLTADLGFMALEVFADRFPDRFFNVGVAEQNMIGIATGLAEAGYFPFVYSIVTFASLRGYEFIRNGPVLHHLPVRIVAVGGGFEYGTAGLTHHGLEDIGVMRLQPGLTVISPADAAQTRSAFFETWNLPGPVYYRLGKNDKVIVPYLDGRFELGRVQTITEGDDLLLIAMGGISSEVTAAAAALEAEGVRCTTLIVSTLNPAPVDDLVAILERFRVAITVEAHYVNGGVGSLVSEIVAEHGLGCRVVRCGVRTASDGITGSQKFLEQRYGLASADIVQVALRQLSRVD
jgi:transketolase